MSTSSSNSNDYSTKKSSKSEITDEEQLPEHQDLSESEEGSTSRTFKTWNVLVTDENGKKTERGFTVCMTTPT